MLDLSQYAAARKVRNLKIIEFWKPDSREDLRKVSLIYDSDQKSEILGLKPDSSLPAKEDVADESDKKKNDENRDLTENNNQLEIEFQN